MTLKITNKNNMKMKPHTSTGKMSLMDTFIFTFLLVLCSKLMNPIGFCNGAKLKAIDKKVALFVFGDSLFDPGNNQYLNGSMKGGENSWPYGETFFKHPTGRISDGRIVPDFIAEFAKLPMLPPYLEPANHRFTDGSNFASGGAGVLGDSSHGTIDLKMQLSHFKEVEKWLKQKLGNVEAKKVLMRSVYLFSIGGNDYFRFYMGNPNASLASKQNYVKMVIGNLTEVLQEIYNMGGRKIGFQNAGPLGCVPSMRAKTPEKGHGCIKDLSALAAVHNRALSNTLNKLQTELHGFKYSIFDYYNTILELVNHPLKHGFKEGKAACYGCGLYRGACGFGTNGTAAIYELCRDPSEYIWFDGGHTTEAANWELAKLIWNGVSNVTGPWNLKKLFQLV